MEATHSPISIPTCFPSEGNIWLDRLEASQSVAVGDRLRLLGQLEPAQLELSSSSTLQRLIQVAEALLCRYASESGTARWPLAFHPDQLRVLVPRLEAHQISRALRELAGAMISMGPQYLTDSRNLELQQGINHLHSIRNATSEVQRDELLASFRAIPSEEVTRRVRELTDGDLLCALLFGLWSGEGDLDEQQVAWVDRWLAVYRSVSRPNPAIHATTALTGLAKLNPDYIRGCSVGVVSKIVWLADRYVQILEPSRPEGSWTSFLSREQLEALVPRLSYRENCKACSALIGRIFSLGPRHIGNHRHGELVNHFVRLSTLFRRAPLLHRARWLSAFIPIPDLSRFEFASLIAGLECKVWGGKGCLTDDQRLVVAMWEEIKASVDAFPPADEPTEWWIDDEVTLRWPS